MDMLIERYNNNETEENRIGSFSERAFWHGDYSTINYRKYVVIAAELTGLDLQKDSLLSIGAIRMEGSRIELGKTFYKALKPKSISRLKNLITNSNIQADKEQKPDIEEILKEFADFCGKDTLVGHSVFVGMNFLDKAAGKIISPVIFNPMLDISLIYEFLKENHPALKRLLSYTGDSSLSALARRFGISVGGPQNALKEALIAAQLFQRFIHLLLSMGINKMEDMEKIGNPLSQKSRYMVSAKTINF